MRYSIRHVQKNQTTTHTGPRLGSSYSCFFVLSLILMAYFDISNQHTSYDPGIYHDHHISAMKSKRAQVSISTVSTSSGTNDSKESDQTPRSRRRRLYMPNSILTRMFATTVITEMVFTVAIEM